jgi:hypothetical protein
MNVTKFHINHDKLMHYSNEFADRLRHKFKGFELIGENYSQAWQDIFVLTMLNGKKNGTFLEIGAQKPIFQNNTFLLETFYDFSGKSIDCIDYSLCWLVRPKSNFLCADALSLDYKKILEDFPKQIDYCQIDIDQPQEKSLEILQKLMNSGHRFSVLMNETDSYGFLSPSLDDVSKKYKMDCIESGRELLKLNGYELLVKDVQNSHRFVIDIRNNKPLRDNYIFEDWWVDPNVIDPEILNKFRNINTEAKHPFFVIVDV